MVKIAGEDYIRESAALRGQGSFDEAITLIEANLSNIDTAIRFNAYREVFEAAKGKGDPVIAKKYAKIMSLEYPDFPSIQDYL